MEKPKLGSSDPIVGSNSASFGDDLLIEIFSRLPVKSLIRSKCVSKAWRNLISSSDALQRRVELSMSGLFYRIIPIRTWDYSKMHKHKYGCISSGDSSHYLILSMSLGFLPFCRSDIRIIDCCNGLLLCLSRESEKRIYYVCNPVTKKWASLPKPRHISCLDNARLVFDPNVSLYFKVICISDHSSLFSTRRITLEIFCSDEGKWVKSKVLRGPVMKTFLLHDAVYLNETLYILGHPCHVVGISLKEPCCQTMINLPGKYHYNRLLRKYRGSLYYTFSDSSRLRLEVWMLKDNYGGEWILKHNINIPSLLDKLPESVSPLSVCQDPSEVHILDLHPDFEVLLFEARCRLYSYELASTRLVEICSAIYKRDYTLPFSNQERFRVYPFTPFLSSFATRGSNGC